MAEKLLTPALRVVHQLFEPVILAAQDAETLTDLFRKLGWDIDGITNFPRQALDTRLAEIVAAFQAFEEIIEQNPDTPEELQNAADVITQLFEAIRGLGTIFEDVGTTTPDSFTDLGADLLSYLQARYVEAYHPLFYRAAIFLTLIELPPAQPVNGQVDEAGNLIRYPHGWPVVRLDRLRALLADPLGFLKEHYFGPGLPQTAAEARQIADRLLPRLGYLLEPMGINAVYGFRPEYGINFGTVGNELGASMMTILLTPGALDDLFGLTIALSAPDQGNLGWVFVPTGSLSYQRRFRDWYLTIGLTGGVQAFAIGLDGQPTLLADAGTTVAQGHIDLTYVRNDTEKALTVGDPLGSHLEIGTIVLGAELEITNASQRYGLTLALGKTTIGLKDLLTLGWEKLDLTFLAGTALALQRLHLQTPLLPGFEIEADLRFSVENGQFRIDPAGFHLYRPNLSGILPGNIHLDTDCLLIQWQDDNPDSWLSQLVPDFLGQSGAATTTVTAQVIWGRPIRQLRLDWEFSNIKRTIAVPGLINIETPNTGFFSLLFGADGRPLSRMSLAYTVLAAADFTFSSNFAWEREADRELHNDAEAREATAPLFVLTLTAPNEGATLILADFDLAVPTIKDLFLQPDNRLTKLRIPAPDEDTAELCQPIEGIGNFSTTGWSASITINYGQLQLPFLKQGDNQYVDIFDPNSEPDSNQSTALTLSNVSLDGNNGLIEVPLGLRLKLGNLNLVTEFKAEFNWRKLTLHVDHEGGIHLYAQKDVLENDFLGLHWKFLGQLETSGPNKGKYRLLTLVTKGYNYQIQQAPGSRIEISYNGISSDPIVFQVTDFAITDKGLSLRTTVLDAPVRLNGLDTKFRFDGSGIVIENSEIQSFTIAGSGALPPDLVGDSRASIALQFGRLNDGNLTLISGEAKLEGNNLLHCQGTRFQFSVDALGLKFVNDGKFHLYFTITGSAQFVLADGDDAEGALALLPKIKLDLIEVPLTGDVSVIGKHIKFLVELPKPVAFSFLGCFEFELRGIGFEPQAEVFDGDGAMLLSGQLKFAQGGGDIIDARIDFHNLHIGLPKPGSFLPRVYFKQLAVSLAISGAFKLSAVVDFRDNALEKGFLGEGMVDIQGLPSMAAAFGFLRVRRDEDSPWLRAWFIYLEVRKISFVIPVVQIYLREVGLGFGYRFTLTSIKAADKEGDIRKLLKELRALSRTQGDLSKRDRWAVDLEDPGQDPRWTIVLRAMIAQTSASALLTYSESAEKDLSCIYLFDAVIAFRSDFTFFMAVRGWFNTNYNDFLVDDEGIRSKPLLSGFVLLAPRQKRFLAHVASNPEGKIGRHPPLPDFVKSAIEAAEFSATLLIEPGLLHYEMGWPNMLRWKGKLGPLEVEFQGGFIFRISKTELVTGTSFMARGTLSLEAGFSAGVFGVSISIFAQVAYGARYIGVLAFQSTALNSAFYGVIGLEIYITITIKFWIKLLFVKAKFKLSIGLGLTAALEVALLGSLRIGVRGQGTLSLKAMGRSIRFSVKVALDESAVKEAIARTEKFLHIGLDSTEVEAIPGLNPRELPAQAPAQVGTAFARQALAAARISRAADITGGPGLNAPDYTIFAMRITREQPDGNSRAETFYVLLPAGERKSGQGYTIETGFLPVPPERPLTLTPTDETKLDETKLNDLASSRTTLPIALANQFNEALAKEGLAPLANNATVRIGHREENIPQEWLIQETDDISRNRSGRFIRIRKMADQLVASTLFDTESDFSADFRNTSDIALLELEQFDPLANEWHKRQGLADTELRWRVNWQALIFEAEGDFSNEIRTNDGEPQGGTEPQTAISLAAYLRGAFIERADGTLSDPLAVDEGANTVEDSRVHNPTDSAFEAAVRGAVEQFAGSPFFKFDLNSSYDNALKNAFNPTTSIYQPEDYDSEDPQQKADAIGREHTDQIRGLIVHDLIADLQEYVSLLQRSDQLQNSGIDETTRAQVDATINTFTSRSIAFQMGLIFKVNGQRPTWLDTIATEEATLPKIGQRITENVNAAEVPIHPMRPFNIPATSFQYNPPRFDRVVHYTNSTTVGITWDLVWDRPPAPGCSTCQAEPEHHLMNYEIRRRALDTQERDVLLTVKTGEILHRATGASAIERLRPRFQFVDHFQGQTEEQRTRIPAQGLTYLYTITPIDFAKNQGRPLTIVATRYPDAPPRVPANGELTVTYRLARTALVPHKTTPTAPNVPTPDVITPDVEQVQIQWTEPGSTTDGADTPIRDYQLVFRREATLPIGSYGLDSTTQRDKVKALPSTNARTRPTDIIVPIDGDIDVYIAPAGIEGAQHNRIATIPVDTLRKAKVFPAAADPQWRPEAWRLFFRTVSEGGVPSALAPVQLKLRVLSGEPETDGFTPLPEERRPAELEWLPKPIQLPLLPPIDQKATTGDAHFPMPLVATTAFDSANADDGRFVGAVTNVTYQLHPAGLRAIRFRWNQGPSAQPDYPLSLNAGYELMELNIDAHTNVTLNEPQTLADVLRPIQEVQMLPADDLILTPDTTLVTTQWEAWYLSTQLRRQIQTAMQQNGTAVEGSESPFSSWFSWRESLLAWPAWPELEAGQRSAVLHPFFEKLIEILQFTADDPADAPDKYIVDLQGIPPLQPMTFTDFRRNTASTADPYGWGVLQRFGLSLTLSLREDGSSDLITDKDPEKNLLNAIQKALTATLAAYPDKTLAKHLHVELLFQPGESVELQMRQTETSSLLGIVQISLRPVPIQYLRYTVVELSGPAGKDVELVFGPPTATISLIMQSETTGTQIDLAPTLDNQEVVQRITLPLNGKSKVLLRSIAALGYSDAAAVPSDHMQIRYPLSGDLAAGPLLDNNVEMRPINNQNYLVFLSEFANQNFPADPSDGFTKAFEEALPEGDKAMALFRFTSPTEFAPTAPDAAYFLTPVDQLKHAISEGNAQQIREWNRFKAYAESLNSRETDAAQTVTEPRITVPTTDKELTDDNLLAQILSWSQRFFDHSGPVRSLAAANVAPEDLLNAQLDGPWLATAYPRAGTPAYATPDDAGRLEYFHLLEDKWAHNYRYYIRPYGRYEKLWRNLYLSPLLWPPTTEAEQAAIAPPQPNLDDGGLDIVLDRVRPVDMPTILRSGRLDRISVPGQPAAPGKIWEVIIAQHREQALSERNQTVYRQLSFRQVAYTLLRRFAYQDVWTRWDNDDNVAFDFAVTYPENGDAELPTTLEATAYTLDDPANLNPEDEIRFALPQRLDTFQQGALVVQWEALPFYYAHRMLAIAQTTSQVSPVNSVIQQDFEYRAPEPGEWDGVKDFRAPFIEGTDAPAIRQIKIPLRRLWDSLPLEVQQRWPDEDPALLLEDQRRHPGILPDPEVVYQVIEYFQGNIEVQVELFLHVPATEDADEISTAPVVYERRTLGKRQTVEPQFIAPQKTQDDETYCLVVPVKQVDEEGLINWEHEVAISVLENPDSSLISDEDFTNAPYCQLAWPGPLTEDEARLLSMDEAGNLSIPGDQQFQVALAQLVAAARTIKIDDPNAITTAIAPLGPEQPRTDLPAGWHYQEFTLTGLPNGATIHLLAALTEGDAPTAPAARITLLRWTGNLFADGRDQLRIDLLNWAQITELSTAVQELFTTLESQTVAVSYSGSATDDDLPEPLRAQMTIADGHLRFTGLVQDAQQWAILMAMPNEATLEEALRNAATALIEQIETDPVDITLDLPLRPRSDDLPEQVRNKLVIGRSLLHFEGIMSVATATTLRDAFPSAADQTAVEYLYRQSIQRGLTSRTLEIRTRRGSADPSARRTLAPQALPPVEGANS